MAQPIKKGQTIKKKSIKDIKTKVGLLNSADGSLRKETSSAMKPMEWILMPNAFQEALKLPGFCQGVTNVITGWSNSGKTSLKNAAIAACQRQGILPVIFETENNFDFKYAIDCGMQAEPVYGDVEVEDVDNETGEVIGTHTENRIVDYDGDFLYYDSAILAEIYGTNDYSGKQSKTSKNKRRVAVMEDIAFCMGELLDMQDSGEIDRPMCFFWDSVGSIPSYKSYTAKVGSNFDDASSFEQAFSVVLNNRIPISKRIESPYTNTCIFVNKIWDSSMQTMGLPSFALKNGKALGWAMRLHIHLGNAGGPGITRLSATAKGETYYYGIKTKIKVMKNHLSQPYNISYEGTLCCLHNGLYAEHELDRYKRTYAKELLQKIADRNSGVSIEDKDITFNEED